MLSVLESLFLGVIQGVTEWLPVSSSGHLALAQIYFGVNVPVLFDVLLHVATLLVLLVYFRRDIGNILKAVFSGEFKSAEGKMGIFILVGTLGTAFVVLFFRELFKSFFLDKNVIGAAILVTGLVLLLSRFAVRVGRFGYFESLLVGLVQGIAVIPGISRSGATIGVGKLLGLDGERAARFSFLLAIPAILGAVVLEFGDINVLNGSLFAVGVGMVASFVVGFISLKWLMDLVRKEKLWVFCFYCFVLGILVLML